MPIEFHTTKPDELDRVWILFHCRGCGFGHGVPISGKDSWSWDGNLEAPTLSPSLKVQTYGPDDVPKSTCHFHVTKGAIRYLDDCTHELRGQTITDDVS